VTCWSSDPEATQLQPSIHLPVQWIASPTFLARKVRLVEAAQVLRLLLVLHPLDLAFLEGCLNVLPLTPTTIAKRLGVSPGFDTPGNDYRAPWTTRR
jgi:hypothetical protein